MTADKNIEQGKARGKCPLCHGTGMIVTVSGEKKSSRKCVQCRGSGRGTGGLIRK